MSDRRASAQGGRDTGPRAHSWSAVGPGPPELVLPRWQLPDWGPGQPRPWAGRRLWRLLGSGTYLLGSARPAQDEVLHQWAVTPLLVPTMLVITL